MNIDESKQEFQDFLKIYENLKQQDISESDTRSKIIDKIFIHILGWRDEDIQREGHVDSGYYDYKISIPGFYLIVEAKKQFIDLTLPINTKRVSINSLYKENKETIKNKDELNRLFDDNPPDLVEMIQAKKFKSIVSQLENEISSIPVVAKETAAPKPIIIVGTKGAGKTTFINYLFKNKLSEDTLKIHPYVYVDFIKYYKEDKTIDTEKISSDILDVIYDNYSHLALHTSKVLKKIYFKEIQRNDESIWEDYKNNGNGIYSEKLNDFFENQTKQKQNHLEYLSRYLVRERRLRLIVIIDNADQFDIDVQEKVFLFANSLNRSAFCGVFISLREGYYYKWRFRPPFNAFSSNVYHVTTPPYSEVLQRRINYNSVQKKSLIEDRLKYESSIVSHESLNVLKEFETI